MSRLSVLLVAFMMASLVLWVSGRPGQRLECRQVRPVGVCLHGHVDTLCGRVCKKGPGGVCGGRQGQYGVCGEGLQCSDCNRCSGCSYKLFRCYSDHDKCASRDDSFL